MQNAFADGMSQFARCFVQIINWKTLVFIFKLLFTSDRAWSSKPLCPSCSHDRSGKVPPEPVSHHYPSITQQTPKSVDTRVPAQVQSSLSTIFLVDLLTSRS